MELTEFLWARIAEDEEGARRGMPERLADFRPSEPYQYDDEYSDVTMSCGRALAECEAKRRIVATMRTALDQAWQDGDSEPVIEFFATRTLRLLAVTYADHPDFDEDWRS